MMNEKELREWLAKLEKVDEAKELTFADMLDQPIDTPDNLKEEPKAKLLEFRLPVDRFGYSKMSMGENAIVIHVNNLINTYGKDNVIRAIEFHYGLTTKKEVVNETL